MKWISPFDAKVWFVVERCRFAGNSLRILVMQNTTLNISACESFQHVYMSRTTTWSRHETLGVQRLRSTVTWRVRVDVLSQPGQKDLPKYCTSVLLIAVNKLAFRPQCDELRNLLSFVILLLSAVPPTVNELSLSAVSQSLEFIVKGILALTQNGTCCCNELFPGSSIPLIHLTHSETLVSSSKYRTC